VIAGQYREAGTSFAREAGARLQVCLPVISGGAGNGSAAMEGALQRTAFAIGPGGQLEATIEG